MLSFLSISDFAIVDDVSIELGPGLNVLTGETGAGKSIVVDAIALLLGGRSGPEMIRSGCERLVVEAQFDLSARPDAAAVASEAGPEIEAPEGELLIRREVAAGGRGRCLVNGRLVTVAALRRLGEALADLHGQHQHQSLLREEGQRDALDRFGGTLARRGEVASLHARRLALQREIEEASSRERERARRQESLQREIAEIEALDPRPGEEASLAREESLLRHAGEVSRLASEAFALLSDDDDAAVTRLAAAGERLARLAAIDPAAQRAAALAGEARLAAAEAAASLSRYLGGEEFDPGRLEAVASRLAALDRLRRRYGRSIEELIALRDASRAELEDLAEAPARLESLARELDRAEEAYRTAAEALSSARKKAAARLSRAVQSELRALAMGGTRVEIAVDPLPGGSGGALGADAVAFLIAPNQGEGLRPLSRIASGGELSRLMLAVRNASSASSDARTLVFDEVDTGVGGTVAESVGQRLAALGGSQQVVCVTHLAPIAAAADRHLRVAKEASGGRTRVAVTSLDRQGRIDELARMLGGGLTATARRHAEAMVGRRGGAATA